MHYYNFHIGDYMSHTRHLSLMEDLAFRRLLDFYYLHEQPIKQRDIARQIGMREHEQDVLTVLNEFFVSTEDGFVNPRADKEIANFKAMSEGGKRGAAKRWSKGSDSPPISTPMPSPIATINQEPITNNHKPIKEKATVVATPEGVSQSVWEDFIRHRRAKKAQVTQTVIDDIAKQAKKAGWPLEDALKEIIVRNWQSFKADWVANKSFAFQDIARSTVPGSKDPDPALLKIEQDMKKAVPIPDHIRQQINQVLRKA